MKAYIYQKEEPDAGMSAGKAGASFDAVGSIVHFSMVFANSISSMVGVIVRKIRSQRHYLRFTEFKQHDAKSSTAIIISAIGGSWDDIPVEQVFNEMAYDLEVQCSNGWLRAKKKEQEKQIEISNIYKSFSP